MGGNQSTLKAPPQMTADEVPYYPPKDKYWVCEPDAEHEIFYAKKGLASEAGFKAITMHDLLKKCVERRADFPALCVERPMAALNELPKKDGKPQIPPITPRSQWKTWTFKQYYDDCSKIARALIALGMKKFDAAAIFGFNSPEWAMAQMSAIFAGGRAAGIYPTDTGDQVQFKCDHANAAVCFVDGQGNFDKMKEVVGKLPYLKGIVSWGPLKSYDKLKNQAGADVQVMSWEDVLTYADKVGKGTPKELEARIAGMKPGQCCVLVYTSGTTGNPKAVMLNHDNVIYEAHVVVQTIEGVGEEDKQERIISYLPLSHVAGMMVDLLAPLAVTAFSPGYGTAYFARPYDMKAGTLVERLQSVQPTLFIGVPRVWEKMADKLYSVTQELTGVKKKLTEWAMSEGAKYTQSCNFGGDGHKSYAYSIADKLVLSKVRAKLGLDEAAFTFTGAAPIQTETQRFMGNFGININEVYGMSEGTGGQSWSSDSCHLWGSCGWPISYTELKIYQGDPTDVNDKKEAPRAVNIFEAKEDEQGEICFRGRNIMMGYMANPRLGKEHVDEIIQKNKDAIDAKGYLHSGDKGAMSKEGFVKITGRFKELIIGAGGENIAPVPIEDNIKRICPLVSNVIMIGDKRKFNVALITLKLEGATGEMPGTSKLLPGLCPTSKTIEEAMSDEKVIKEIESKIIETNNNGSIVISNACKIQKFTILPRDVSIQTGDLTATLKLKRSVVADKYKQIIDNLYACKGNYYKFPMDKFNEFYKGY